MAEQRVVTIAEVADALGVPGQAVAVQETLVSDGVTIVEDWAGRPAVAFHDAKKIVDRHRKQQAEWEERRRREDAEQHEANQAQAEFDELCGRLLPALRAEEPFRVSHEDESLRVAAARRIAWEQIAGKYSKGALAKVVLRPSITTIEPDDGTVIKLIPVPATETWGFDDEIPNPARSSRVAKALGLKRR